MRHRQSAASDWLQPDGRYKFIGNRGLARCGQRDQTRRGGRMPCELIPPNRLPCVIGLFQILGGCLRSNQAPYDAPHNRGRIAMENRLSRVCPDLRLLQRIPRPVYAERAAVRAAHNPFGTV
jgi:hypothetical protein